MASNRDITSNVTNHTVYSFSLARKHLSSGNWVTSPRDIPASTPPPPDPPKLLLFEAKGVSGTATGAVGEAEYNVIHGQEKVGYLKLQFSDPYSGDNWCRAVTNVPKLVVSNDCPPHHSTITVDWQIASA